MQNSECWLICDNRNESNYYKNGLNLSYLSLQLLPLQYHFAPSSIKRQSLFFHPVSLDWPWDSLW